MLQKLNGIVLLLLERFDMRLCRRELFRGQGVDFLIGTRFLLRSDGFAGKRFLALCLFAVCRLLFSGGRFDWFVLLSQWSFSCSCPFGRLLSGCPAALILRRHWSAFP
jgi:hypothetical protein